MDFDFIAAQLGAVSLLSIIYTFYILANLSRRYGEVIRMPPHYRGFYFAIGLVVVALSSHLLRDMVILDPEQEQALLNNDWFYLLAFYLPLALAITLAIIIAWRYWSWILKEQEG